MPTLPVGDYEVRIEAAGFKSLTRSNLRLDGDAVLSLNLQLEVGQITERVEVTAEAPPDATFATVCMPEPPPECMRVATGEKMPLISLM